MEKPKIGLTIGDINGIGVETIIKVFSDDRIFKYLTPILYGSTRVLSFYKKKFNAKKFNYTTLKDWDNLMPKALNVVSCIEEEPVINVGEETEEAARYAFSAINKSLEDWKNGKIDGIVTAPINKNSVAKIAEEKFSGHTEYISSYCEVDESLMLLTSDYLKVGLVTNHLSLKEVVNHITNDLIIRKIELLNKTLQQDFGINRPKIAVLALNPHAGDKGLLGAEEQDIIIPAISKVFRNDILAFGPFPADGFFGSSDFKKFDGVLAMYHDQGLTPFKALLFDEGVNFTAGLPLVRTSPDHGTAYAIAGENIASEKSLRNAIFTAIDVVKNRKQYLDIKENAIKPKRAR